MLDIRLIRDRPEEIERALAEKGGAALVKELVASDVVRRRLIHESEELKAEHGRASQEMGKKQAAGGIPADVREAMRARSDKIKMLDAQVKEADEKVHALLLEIPNVPHPSVPRGTSDADNVEVRRWGTPRVFDFPPKPHEEVGVARELLDLRACRQAEQGALRRAVGCSAPGSSGRSGNSCWISTCASTATPSSGCRIS